MNPFKLIGAYRQRRREAYIKATAKHDAHLQWLAYMRRKRVIMPNPERQCQRGGVEAVT